MIMTLITAPAAEPLSLTEAKNHLRVEITEDDDLINALISAAREWAEEIQGLAYITQTWELQLDSFPDGAEIRIPRLPLQSVVSFKYYDQNGAETVWDAANYLADPGGGRISLAYGISWPNVTLQPVAGIKIQIKIGYGDTAESVPQRIRAAIKLLLGHLYENREAVMADARLREIPMGAKRLLQLDRVVKV